MGTLLAFVQRLKSTQRLRTEIRSAQGGFSLTEMLIATGILSFSVLAIGAFSSFVADFSQGSKAATEFSALKTYIYTLATHPKRWNALVANAGAPHPANSGILVNPSLICLRDGVACAEGEYDLTLFEIDGRIFIDADLPNTGFTRSGSKCDTYNADPNHPNPECPTRFRVTWSPICPPPSEGPCVRPQIKLSINAATMSSATSGRVIASVSGYNVLIARPRPFPPVITPIDKLTNSQFHKLNPSGVSYGYESTITIDISSHIVSDSFGPFLVSISSARSAKNAGDVSVVANKLVYTPDVGFYGLDMISFTVTDASSGTSTNAVAWVRVMTPYTWTGLAGDGLTSNLRNFCGRVVNSVCDGAVFPVSNASGGDTHWIFNENCTNCDAVINAATSIQTFEMTEAFPGTVRQRANLSAVFSSRHHRDWRKYPFFHIKGGTYIGEAGRLRVSTNHLHIAWGAAFVDSLPPHGFVLSGGRFLAPPMTMVVGDLQIDNPAYFSHRNGMMLHAAPYANGMRLYAKDVDFWNFTFSDNTYFPTNYMGSVIKDGFTVLNDVTLDQTWNQDQMSAADPAAPPVVSIKGNLFLKGRAGGYGGTYTTASSRVIFELNGTGDQRIEGPSLASNNAADIPSLNSLRVNKASGNTRLSGSIGYIGSFEFASTNSIDSSTMKLMYTASGGGYGLLKTNGVPIPEFSYNARISPGRLIVDDDTVHITGDLYIAARATSSGSPFLMGTVARTTRETTFEVEGNMYVTGGFDHNFNTRAVTIRFVGNRDVVINGIKPTEGFPAIDSYVQIAKSGSARVRMEGELGLMQGFKYISGALEFAPGFTIFNFNGGTNGITLDLDIPTSLRLPRLRVEHHLSTPRELHVDNLDLYDKYGGTSAAKNLTLGGRLVVHGNITSFGSHEVKSNSIYLAGDSSQNITLTWPTTATYVTSLKGQPVKISKAFGTAYLRGSGRIEPIEITQGTMELDASVDSSLTVNINVLAGTTLKKNGATPSGTISGSGTILP